MKCTENWFSCHFLILRKTDTLNRKCFIFFLPPPTSIFKDRKSRFLIHRKRQLIFQLKQIFFLNQILFSQIFHRSRLWCWRSLVSCADWLLKCKINLYLTDVKNMTLWDNDRFCNRLVVVLSKWNEWSFGANSLKNDNMIINNWLESRKKKQQQN